jgi:hypothetical protein
MTLLRRAVRSLAIVAGILMFGESALAQLQ